jgi:hypothetical protein
MKITELKQLLAPRRCEDREKVELRNRVATLEIQSGRIKGERDQAREERDEARAHLKRIHASIALMT